VEDERETLKLCPVCGAYDVPRVGCKVCDGRGLVSLAELETYADRQNAKRSSTTLKELPTQIRDALASLRRRGSGQTASLVEIGEVLLRRFENEPPDRELYIRLADWLAAVGPIISRVR
jgi:hypothetical protein